MYVSNKFLMLLMGIYAVSGGKVHAQEILVGQEQNTDMVVSVYNNNLGLIHDTRKVSLHKGKNEVAFEGVASTIQPESAVLSGAGINVLEQNYDYNLLTGNNLLESYIGKEVKTAIQNPQNGQMIFNKAILLSNNYGSPVLRFDYGVEANFPGRVIFDNVPQNLRVKPTLVAGIENQTAETKNLELTYLASGLSWKADYVAKIVSDSELDLNTWITLKNETGADYENAKVQLISGSVNHTSTFSGAGIRPMMVKAARTENAAMDAAGTVSIAPQSVADYYMYKLPQKTTIKDKQSKQISLMNINNVKYEKEYRFSSPLYLGVGASKSEFEKQHPNIVFKLNNEKSSNLGQPLPSGMVRFYENKDEENMVFLGENRIEQTAVGEKAELNIGQAFDIYANGKVTDVKAVSKDIYEYKVEVSFKNVSANKAEIVFEQNIYNNWEILQENMKSKQKNASISQWRFELQPQDQKVLNFTVRVNRNI